MVGKSVTFMLIPRVGRDDSITEIYFIHEKELWLEEG